MMSDQSKAINTLYLENLKAAAEAQMRRSAPELHDDAGPKHKKQKLSDGQEDTTNHVDSPVGRYAYAALDALAKGCTAFLGSCGFRRERSSTKEVLDILHKVLPEGTKLELVKVGCNGLVVITAEPSEGQQQVDSVAVVQDILQQMESGKLQRTKFCQRIMPAQTTCTLTATALTAALTTVVSSYIQQHHNHSSSSSNRGDHPQLQFAVAYKNRDNVTVNSKQHEEQGNPQQHQQQQQDQQEHPEQRQAAPQQQQQRQQQQAASGALQPVPADELVDRGKAIQIAAAVMQECCKDIGGAKVNLVNPQVVLLLEVVPLARHQLACAVAAVPAGMMLTKPKLVVKPTGSASK